MTRLVARGFVPYRQRGGRPYLAGGFVANVDCFSGRVENMVVGPRRELIFVAIERPGKARAGFRDQESEGWIGYDIDPRLGRAQTLVERDDVFAAAIREAAETIEELQSLLRQARVWRFSAARRARQGTLHWLRILRTHDLFGERATTAQEHRARHGLQLRARLRCEEIAAQQEYFPAHSTGVRRKTQLAATYQRFQRILQLLHVGCGFLVDDDDVCRQLLHPPVFVRAQHLADDVHVVGIVNPRENDRQIAGNSLRPERGNIQRTAGQHIGGGTERRIHVEDGVREALEQKRLFRSDAQVMQLHLRLRPRQRVSTLEGSDVAIFVGEIQHLFARGRGNGRKNQ